MKKLMTILAMMILFAAGAAIAVDTVEPPKSCQICGMDRTMFAHSRMVVAYADGSTVGVCSIHCAAEDIMVNKTNTVKTLQVADFRTKILTRAQSATWVMGGKKKGVMTALPKWAFASNKDAREYLKENGGKLATFDQAMKSARKEVVEMAN